MGYRKPRIIYGGSSPSITPLRHVSIHIDDVAAPAAWEDTIFCDKCKRYYECTFSGAKCHLQRKMYFCGVQTHLIGNNLKILVPEKDYAEIKKTIQQAFDILQNKQNNCR